MAVSSDAQYYSQTVNATVSSQTLGGSSGGAVEAPEGNPNSTEFGRYTRVHYCKDVDGTGVEA
ncbi:hypothetical protein JZ751_022787 [Albula glossodonta]|uniref:Uncharacterized protein n=1 Tax=Albula glossodonta TaxID=121402 RepID=A0A8T2PII2_9TELE|nr:hypothetical protein JZ751_022787 [Albula glossodonta]